MGAVVVTREVVKQMLDQWIGIMVQQNADPRRADAGLYDFGYDVNKKYYRVWSKAKSSTQRSALYFVDKVTGDVYRADSWKQKGRRTGSLEGLLVNYDKHVEAGGLTIMPDHRFGRYVR